MAGLPKVGTESTGKMWAATHRKFRSKMVSHMSAYSVEHMHKINTLTNLLQISQH